MKRSSRKLYRSAATLLPALCALCLGPPAVFGQGSLTPPAGSPAQGMKRLDQLAPRVPLDAAHTPGDTQNSFVIAQPGCYYLTANLNGQAGLNGIHIISDNVTLDLCGFSLTGGSGTTRGILVDAVVNTVIRNGSVKSWALGGIDASAASACSVSQVLASNNGGMLAAAPAILLGGDSRVISCCAADNLDTGIQAGDRSIIEDCISHGNKRGVVVSAGCHVSRCLAAANTYVGIQTGDRSVVEDSIASANPADGVSGGTGCQLRGLIASHNGGTGSTGNGILAGDSTTVENCTVNYNRAIGIRVGSNCSVITNLASSNGLGAAAAGIRATGSGNLIDANQTRDNINNGIMSDGGAVNPTTRNTSGANTVSNYQPLTGSTVGPIQTPSAATSAQANF